MKKWIVSCCTLLAVVLSLPAWAQPANSIGTGDLSGAGINAITTAVPFLRINPDSRAGAMGDATVATEPDVNSAIYGNQAKLAFLKEDYGFSMAYTPWLQRLTNDIHLIGLNGYYKVSEKDGLGMGLKFFSLGNIQYTDINGEDIGQGNPNEFALDMHYARRLSERFSVGVGLRFIYSNLAQGSIVPQTGNVVTAGKAGAADISFFLRNPIKVGGMNTNLNFGLAITNIGSKITYTNDAIKDYLPTNLGLGLGWELDIDEANELNIYVEMNKLMVPTPDTTDNDANGVPDYREKSVPAAVFGSFGDAPGGFGEEMREFNYSIGLEYWYNNLIAARLGYFHEHATKGNRKLLSTGLSLRYNIFTLHFSYLIPTSSQINPLDNTLRFTLVFDFYKGGFGGEGDPPPGL